MTFLNYHYILTGQKNYADAVYRVPAALLTVETVETRTLISLASGKLDLKILYYCTDMMNDFTLLCVTEFKLHTLEGEWYIGKDNNTSVISCGQFFGLLLLQDAVFFQEDQECTSLPSRPACSERSFKNLSWLWSFSKKKLDDTLAKASSPKLCQEASLGSLSFPGELLSRVFPHVQHCRHCSLVPLQFGPRPNGLIAFWPDLEPALLLWTYPVTAFEPGNCLWPWLNMEIPSLNTDINGNSWCTQYRKKLHWEKCFGYIWPVTRVSWFWPGLGWFWQ